MRTMKDISAPCVTVETVAGSRDVALSVVHRTNGNIFISGEIDREAAENFLLQMLYYEQEFPERPVNVFINSPGGEVRSGLIIIDILKKTKLDVNLICCGIAYSMAAVILSSARPGHRYAYEHAHIMIHEPLISRMGGSASNIREISENMMRTRDILNGILAEHTGRTIEEINKATSFDNYMSAEEALRFGIVDMIMDGITL